MTAKPPFRADHVGSLLRPQPITDARAKHFESKVFFEDQTYPETEPAAEDAAVIDVIKLQEDVGMPVTDGEFRRSFWHYDAEC